MSQAFNREQGSQEPTPELPSPEEPAVTLTPEAVERVRDAMRQEGLSPDSHGIRAGVISGGCCGLQYMLDFASGPAAEDMTYDLDGLRVYVDPFSASHLAGTVIDYVRGPSGTGFRFNNPSIGRACGCGATYGA